MKAEPFIGREPTRMRRGKHKIKAALLEITDDSIRVRKEDNKELKVKLEKLSETDQKFIRSLVAQGIGKPINSLRRRKETTNRLPVTNRKRIQAPLRMSTMLQLARKQAAKRTASFPLPSQKSSDRRSWG